MVLIENKSKTMKNNLQIDAFATNIVRTGESLLGIIAQLKHIKLLNDFTSIETEALSKAEEYKQQSEISRAALKRLQNNISLALYELEDSYYSIHVVPEEEPENGDEMDVQ
eukprot:TRINITY_DN2583_c0_g1_i2.p1 TRINITY_DN2583_c0_g1~~TRINITY_DN2583_c0_g1_i2.p1  ORF type:complete len:111 (-),score=38.58 TRINITY_DN2583_c0_g1_i2:24-356(-)